jgi:hypothetical protein
VRASSKRSIFRLFITFILTLNFFTFTNIQPASAGAQIVANEGFLQGLYAEVGIRANGAFGSSSVPSGFHATNSPCIGFRVDRSKDGWGNTIDDGDFFCPGSPYEDWALSVGGSSFNANSNSATTIPGANSNATTSGTTHSVTWTSTSNLSGVAVQIINSMIQITQQRQEFIPLQIPS